MERHRHHRPSSDEDCTGDLETHRPPTSARSLPILRGFLPFPSLLLPSLVVLLVTILLLLPPQLIAQPLQPSPQTELRQQRPSTVASHAPTRHLINDHRMSSPRSRRQSKPRESIWQLYFRLMSEGSNDTVSAFQQIRQLFSTLIEPEKPRENLSAAENATVTEEAGGGGGDEVGGAAAGANETLTTTTTEPTPRKISTSELMGIFRRNVFGLGRLFGREFWNAIQQSNKNIEMYSKEWQDAIRPYVE